jgi:hypothetical protein
LSCSSKGGATLRLFGHSPRGKVTISMRKGCRSGRWAAYQKQPAHRDESIEEQLTGFLWNRKHRYGLLIVGTLDLGRIPRPLTAVLAHALPAEAPRL